MSRVLVAGSINMDIVATTERYPKPGETVCGHTLHFFPGGKGANQAVAAAKLGAKTLLIGKLGNDDFADEIHRFLKKQDVDLKYVTQTLTTTTGTALIVLAKSENRIIVIPGANEWLSEKEIDEVAIHHEDILISQCEIRSETTKHFFIKGKSIGAKIIFNPAPAKLENEELLQWADILVVNETELALFLREKEVDERSLPSAARQLQAYSKQAVIVTLGSNGVFALSHHKPMRFPGHKVRAIDSTGAGDCFVGALAAEMAKGADLERAIYRANLAASICVQRMGAGPSMPTEDEVDQAEKN